MQRKSLSCHARIFIYLTVGLLLPRATLADQVPVAPILPASEGPNQGLLRLHNAECELLLNPATGTLQQFNFIGGKALLAPAGSTLTLIGPDKLPEPQREGRGWINADGTQNALLTREYGSPLNLRVSRFVRLHPDSSRISIRQRVERLDAGSNLIATQTRIPLAASKSSEVCIRPYPANSPKVVTRREAGPGGEAAVLLENTLAPLDAGHRQEMSFDIELKAKPSTAPIEEDLPAAPTP